jgi:hypothetical protein
MTSGHRMRLIEKDLTHMYCHDDKQNEERRCRHQHSFFAVMHCLTDKTLIFA